MIVSHMFIVIVGLVGYGIVRIKVAPALMKIDKEFRLMKRCDLLSDPVRQPINGRVVGMK